MDVVSSAWIVAMTTADLIRINDDDDEGAVADDDDDLARGRYPARVTRVRLPEPEAG